MRKIRYDWKMIEFMCEDIANQIIQSGVQYDYIYGLPRGGLIPAVMISHILDIPMYTDMVGGYALVVDDIVDSGNTMDTFLQSQDIVQKIDVASLFWRKNVASLKPKYYAATVDNEDVWIVFPYERSNDSVSKVICKV